MNSIKYLTFFTLLSFCISCAKPIANFTIEQDSEDVPATIRFINSSENADSFVWDFGDGNASNDTNVANRYYLSGKYKVSLTAKKGKKMNMKYI